MSTTVATRQPGSRTPGLLAVLLGVVLAGALPLYSVAATEDVGRSDAWMLTLGVTVYAGGRLALLLSPGRPRFFDLFLWLYVYLFLGLAPTIQIRTDLFTGTTSDVEAVLDVPTAVVIILGLVAYEIGRGAAVLREGREAEQPVATGAEPVPPRGGLDISALRLGVLTAFGLLATAYVALTLGLSSFFDSREAALIARAAAWPDSAVRSIILALGLYPLLISIGALVQRLRATTDRTTRTQLQVVVVVGVLMLMVVVSPIGTPRYVLGTVVFSLAVFFGAALTRRRVRATMIGSVLGLMLVFPVADSFRREGGTLQRGTGFVDEYLGPDYDSYWQIANAYAYWRDGLVEPLNQILGSTLFWVPRGVWTDKPVDTGVLLADYRNYDFDNLSAPLWAEALVNGGMVALVLVFLALGFGLRVLDTRLDRALGRPGLWAIVGAVFPVYSLIILRGSLLQATGSLVVAVACVLFLRAGRGRARRRSSDPQASAYSSASLRATALMLSRSRT
jgi:hypothetical protein